jgi:predicted DNA-binding protein
VATRVNLSLPNELAQVLRDLSAATGRAQASYAREALTWYLPRLRALQGALARSGRGGVGHRRRRAQRRAPAQG